MHFITQRCLCIIVLIGLILGGLSAEKWKFGERRVIEEHQLLKPSELSDKVFCGICWEFIYPSNYRHGCPSKHPFHYNCLAKWKRLHRDNFQCPMCRALFPAKLNDLTRYDQDSEVLNIYEKFLKKKIRCQFFDRNVPHQQVSSSTMVTHSSEKGCSWTNTISAYTFHVKKCQFQPVPCPYDCNLGRNKKIPRHDLPAHVTQCSITRVTCKNDGCTDCVTRKLLSSHEQKCMFAIVPCQHAPSCGWIGKRQDLESHLINDCGEVFVVYSHSSRCTHTMKRKTFYPFVNFTTAFECGGCHKMVQQFFFDELFALAYVGRDQTQSMNIKSFIRLDNIRVGPNFVCTKIIVSIFRHQMGIFCAHQFVLESARKLNSYESNRIIIKTPIDTHYFKLLSKTCTTLDVWSFDFFRIRTQIIKYSGMKNGPRQRIQISQYDEATNVALVLQIDSNFPGTFTVIAPYLIEKYCAETRMSSGNTEISSLYGIVGAMILTEENIKMPTSMTKFDIDLSDDCKNSVVLRFSADDMHEYLQKYQNEQLMLALAFNSFRKEEV